MEPRIRLPKVFVYRPSVCGRYAIIPAGIATDGAGDTVSRIGAIVRIEDGYVRRPVSIAQDKLLPDTVPTPVITPVVAMPTVPVVSHISSGLILRFDAAETSVIEVCPGFRSRSGSTH